MLSGSSGSWDLTKLSRSDGYQSSMIASPLGLIPKTETTYSHAQLLGVRSAPAQRETDEFLAEVLDVVKDLQREVPAD